MTFRVTDLMFDVVARKPGKKKFQCPAPTRVTPRGCTPKTYCGDCTNCTKTGAECQGCTQCSPCTATGASACTTASDAVCEACGPEPAGESNNLVELRNALRARLQKVEDAA
jgi:hypothetical protein